MTHYMLPPKTRGDTRCLVRVSGEAFTYAQIATRMGKDPKNEKDMQFVWSRVRALRKRGAVTWEGLGVNTTEEQA